MSRESKSLRNAKEIAIACKEYAIDNNENYPPSLAALVPAYLKDRSFLISPFNPAGPVGYIYTPGLRNEPPYDAIMIEDKYSTSIKHERIVVYANGLTCVLRLAPEKSGAIEAAFKNAKTVGLCCTRYANDHGGNYPPSLDDLIPHYLPSRSYLASPLMPADPVGYYYRPGLRTDTGSDFVLIADRFASLDQCGIIIYSDGTAQIINSWPVPKVSGT